jgi:hypothetical protein
MNGRVTRFAAPVAVAAALSLSAVPSFAQSNGGGTSADAPGQVQAEANCHNVYVNQFDNGVIIKGGPKAGFGEPQYNTPDNCDHYYGAPGQLPSP